MTRSRSRIAGAVGALVSLGLVSCAHTGPASIGNSVVQATSFQIRLVSPDPTPATEPMRFTRRLAHAGQPTIEYLHVHREVLLDQAAIERIFASTSPFTGVLEVHVVFTDQGARQFARITREHTQERLAIVVAGEIVVAPVVRMEVDGGTVVISNFGSDEEAKQLAIRLNEGLRR